MIILYIYMQMRHFVYSVERITGTVVLLLHFAGSAPHVELVTDNLGDNATNDPSIQLLRSFQDRLNRRIEKASKTLQGGLFRPEGTDPVYSSSSEASTREQTPSVAGGTSSSREVTPSSREVTPSQGSESVGASSYESEEVTERAACGGGGSGSGGEGPENSVNGVEVEEEAASKGERDESKESLDNLSTAKVDALHISESVPSKEKEPSPVPSVSSENSTSLKRRSRHTEETLAVNGDTNGAMPKPKAETDV